MQESQPKTIENGEIDLRELVRTVLRNKRAVVIAMVLAVGAAAAYSALSPKHYQISAAIEIGAMANACSGIGSQSIEPPLQIKEKIERDIYGIQARKNIGGNAVKIFSSNPMGTNVIFLSVNSADPDKARDYMAEVCRIIEEDHRQIADRERQYFEGRLSRIREDLAKLKSGAAPFAASADRYSGISGLEEAENCSQLALSSIKYTRVIQPASAIEQLPLSPGLKIFLAAVAGLFAGIFAVFAIQWWRNP
ncbi:MAG: Wzz/FepE/Etk N-terminal domain-containing protein [Candidatus Pacebacteria bacterium]|jgi:hypothetical protein|nr:Wzz/FepE/Etk N-terminal domain-containing protein [Candidatus Paceibacterota bacterium]